MPLAPIADCEDVVARWIHALRHDSSTSAWRGLVRRWQIGVSGERGRDARLALRFKIKTSGHESYFFWYVTICAAISLAVYLKMSETKGRKFE